MVRPCTAVDHTGHPAGACGWHQAFRATRTLRASPRAAELLPGAPETAPSGFRLPPRPSGLPGLPSARVLGSQTQEPPRTKGVFFWECGRQAASGAVPPLALSPGARSLPSVSLSPRGSALTPPHTRRHAALLSGQPLPVLHVRHTCRPNRPPSPPTCHHRAG